VVDITVLFADLSSFTELTQELGAEKTAVVDAFLRTVTDVVSHMKSRKDVLSTVA
jgi:class 3 adenylate cyclase